MKKLIFLLSALALILALVPAGMTEGKKPAPSLRCTTEYWWMPGWEGTISGDIEGVIVWPGGPMRFAGQTSHYGGRFEIYVAGNLVLAGEGAGSTTVRHGRDSIWRANGIVTEAYGEFEDWLGRQVHQDGHFTWVIPGLIPDQGWGTFRVN